jgi:hypothetical protein
MTCPECKKEFSHLVPRTEDHILPRWFTKRLHLFDIEMDIPENKQYVCFNCNQDKGGVIDYSIPMVRSFMKDFVHQINKKLL